jgi:mannose-1-phosphate guanylyltransferase
MPKQFLDILGIGKSLLQITYDRFLKLCPSDNIIIVSNEKYIGLIQEQLPNISLNQIIAEPSRNNTAPCVAYTALKAFKMDHNANLVLAPSDHYIENEDAFISNIKKGLKHAEAHGSIVTLGIKPNRPATGYGYIQHEINAEEGTIHKLIQFTEKPNIEKAKAFVQSGDYVWNSGIFIFKADTIIGEFKAYAKDIIDLLEPGLPFINTEKENDFLKENYPKTRSTSIDYAIMEHTQKAYTIPADFSWSDLGSWNALHDWSTKDEFQNMVSPGNSIINDTKNTLVRFPKDKLVVIKGLENFIVVDEGDVLMIYPKEDEQEVKQIRKTISERFGTDQL